MAAADHPRRRGHTDVDAVVVLAMGGSAIGAELVAAAAGDRLRVPLIVHRDYGLAGRGRGADPHRRRQPLGRDGRDALRIRARRRSAGCRRPSSPPVGGWRVGRGRRPACRCSSTGSAGSRAPPSASASASSTSCLRAPASSSGPDELGPAVAAARGADRAHRRHRSRPMRTRPSSWPGRSSAASRSSTATAPMAAVAHRWKTQLNENAKAWASWEPMPEANHNAIEGSLNPRELGDALYVVQLRDPRRAGRDRRALPRGRGAAR